MILIPHYVNISTIEGAGVGLFVSRYVSKGEVIYRFDERFVKIFTDSEVATFPESVQASLRKYGYRGKGADRLQNAIYFCIDDSRFFNHSLDPNAIWVADDNSYVAAYDIPAHSELTCNYGTFKEAEDWVAYGMICPESEK